MMRVRHLKSKEDPIYPFTTAADYRKVCQKSGGRLGLNNLHPYQTRHGGASEDLNSGERDHQGVKIKGRWHTVPTKVCDDMGKWAKFRLMIDGQLVAR